MKLITAIIKPDKVEALRQALTGVDIQGLTIVEAKGYGRQKGHTELYRGAEYEVHFLPKSRAEVLVDSADVEKVITTISEAVKLRNLFNFPVAQKAQVKLQPIWLEIQAVSLFGVGIKTPSITFLSGV